MTMRSYVFRIELEREEDGRWSASVPALVGCAAWGDTAEEAVDAVTEAAKAYVEVLLEDGRPIPAEDETNVNVDRGSRRAGHVRAVISIRANTFSAT